MHIGLVNLKWEGHHTPYVVYLLQYFTENGHEVTFITDKENPRLDELPQSEVLHIRTLDITKLSTDSPEDLSASVREQWYRTQQLQETYQIARGVDVDIVHLLYFDRTQIPLWIADLLSTEEFSPTVATLHRDAFLNNSDRSLSKVATQGATKLALHSTLTNGTLDLLTVHANSIRDRIIGAVPAATRENAKTIPAPTPEPSVDISQEEARNHLDLPQDVPVFLFFGGLRYEKGPDLLADALQEVDRDVTIIFAGSEADFDQRDVDRWKQRVPKNVSIDDRIEFIPEEEVMHYFIATDSLVLPYRRKRGISGPLRRAAWVSTPIIGKKNSDIGDLIETYQLGETFDSRKSLSTILSSFKIGEDDRYSESLVRFAHSRHWSKTGSTLIQLYERVLSTERNR